MLNNEILLQDPRTGDSRPATVARSKAYAFDPQTGNVNRPRVAAADEPHCRRRVRHGRGECARRQPPPPKRPFVVRSSSVGLRQRILRMMTRSLLGSVTGRSALTWSAVTDAAPLPQAERTKVNTWAISSLVSCTRYGGLR